MDDSNAKIEQLNPLVSLTRIKPGKDDKAIDTAVYDLYGLTEDEVRVVER